MQPHETEGIGIVQRHATSRSQDARRGAALIVGFEFGTRGESVAMFGFRQRAVEDALVHFGEEPGGLVAAGEGFVAGAFVLQTALQVPGPVCQVDLGEAFFAMGVVCESCLVVGEWTGGG